MALRRASKTPKSTSLGTVLKPETIRAFGILFASTSAPEEVWATTSSVRLPTGQLLQLVGVPSPLHLDICGGATDLTEIVGGEFE